MKTNLFGIVLMSFVPLFYACSGNDEPACGDRRVPDGMVEVCPVLPGLFDRLPRDVAAPDRGVSRAYDDNDITNGYLVKTLRLPEESTVWLIAKSKTDNSYVKKSYVVHNPEGDAQMSYLVPCAVDSAGNPIGVEGTPLYLKRNETYLFYAVSPARALDEDLFREGRIGFKVRNGEYFYANDCRYDKTTPVEKKVEGNNPESVQEIKLNPMINQTAELKFQIEKGDGVHDLDIQPSGIEISGLQYDAPDGIDWHMSQSDTDEPIDLKHAAKAGIFNRYNYEIDAAGRVNIEVPIIPMWCTSKPVIVIFRLKINGVPSSYEMMLNEKDFKAGYSYGYKGKVSISEGVDVITWQYVMWETSVEFPFK